MSVLLVLVVAGLVGAGAGAALAGPARHDPTAPRLDRGRIRTLLSHRRHLRALARRNVDPALVTGAVLAATAAVLLGTTALAGIVLLLANEDRVHGRTDGPVVDWAAASTTPVVADVARVVTLLGGTWTVVALALALAVVEHRRRPAPGLVAFLALVVVGHLAVVHLAKVVIDRARPDVLQLAETATASFPSGHAAAAAACYAAFALVLGRGRGVCAHRWLAAAAGAVALTVAVSRVALGVHWTTDVVAGLVVGWGWFVACSLAVGGPALRLGDPVALAHDEAGGGRAEAAVAAPARWAGHRPGSSSEEGCRAGRDDDGGGGGGAHHRRAVTGAGGGPGGDAAGPGPEVHQPEGMISPEVEAALVAETVDTDHDPDDDDPDEDAPATGG